MENAEKERVKRVPFRFVPSRRVIENLKKISKKIQKIKKNTVMYSFQAKIGWKKMRKGENNNYRFISFRFYPTRNRKFQKINKKIQKIKKYHYSFISSQNRLENTEKERI